MGYTRDPYESLHVSPHRVDDRIVIYEICLIDFCEHWSHSETSQNTGSILLGLGSSCILNLCMYALQKDKVCSFVQTSHSSTGDLTFNTLVFSYLLLRFHGFVGGCSKLEVLWLLT